MKKTFKTIVFLFIGFTITSMTHAQKADQKISFGVESEILTFINKGYHGSFWVGMNGIRARFVCAQATSPSFLSPKGFKDLKTQFYEMEVDVYFGKRRNEFRGLWVALGPGLTKQSIKSKDTNIKGKITMFDIHSGIGYSIGMYKGLYINPWIGLDLHTNAKDVQIGNETWKPNLIDPVGGAKIGYSF